MDKQRVENSSVETTWVPRTPIKPVAPVYTDHSQTEEMRIIGNKDGLDHLSFCDLLAHANSGSSVFLSGQTEIDKEHISKTPEKPKRKYRPKVVREVKPKRDPKPNTLKKPDGQESKTPKRKYVRKDTTRKHCLNDQK